MTALILMCSPPKSLLAPQTISTTLELELEYDWILASIYKANEETVTWRKYLGRPVRPITTTRAKDLAAYLQSQARESPSLFYGVWFPTLWTGAGFWNGRNDKNLIRSKQTHGYSELQVRTARAISVVTGHEIPKDLSQAESYLITHWEGNLDMGNHHMNYLWIQFKGNDLKAMNAYAAGIYGTEMGNWVVTKRQVEIREFCLGFQGVLGAMSRSESNGGKS